MHGVTLGVWFLEINQCKQKLNPKTPFHYMKRNKIMDFYNVVYKMYLETIYMWNSHPQKSFRICTFFCCTAPQGYTIHPQNSITLYLIKCILPLKSFFFAYDMCTIVGAGFIIYFIVQVPWKSRFVVILMSHIVYIFVIVIIFSHFVYFLRVGK